MERREFIVRDKRGMSQREEMEMSVKRNGLKMEKGEATRREKGGGTGRQMVSDHVGNQLILSVLSPFLHSLINR